MRRCFRCENQFKWQLAKGVAQGSNYNPAAFPALLRSPAGAAHPGSADSFSRSAAFRVAQGSLFNPAAFPIRRSPGFSPSPFPSLFPSSAAELNTDGGPDSDCGAKDLEKPQGLKGEPCATPDPESRAPAVLRMKLVGANPQAKVSGLEEQPGKSNYFIGNDPKKWRTNVTNYAKVKYANVYPGVDLVYYGNQGQLEYDFVVQPGADPRQIALDVGAALVAAQGHPQEPALNGVKGVPLHVDGKGDLVVDIDGGEVIFHKPVVYQPSTIYEPRTKNQEPRTKNSSTAGTLWPATA